MFILVLNCGSSSVKFQLVDQHTQRCMAKGLVERIGLPSPRLVYRGGGNGTPIKKELEIRDHAGAITVALRMLTDPEVGVMKDRSEVAGVGHRVVHGGERFSDSVLITAEVLDEIKACERFAPLHNPHNLRGILVCQELLPGVPQVAVFDTAFHQTMPPEAYLYAVPMELYRKLKIRKYGFHGTSHKYVAEQAAQILGRPLQDLRIITCHLGNGASMAAVLHGKSVDTSMGFTPLEGLVMGTRCGDMDPACVTHIIYEEKLSPTQVDELLNKKSGMLGLCETTSDMRDIERLAMEGSAKHRLALEIYCRRILKYVGAYAAVLGGVDALVFTAGVGENSPIVRRKVCERLGYLGVRLDHEKNERSDPLISTGSPAVLVIPTNEELAIARDTAAVIAAAQ